MVDLLNGPHGANVSALKASSFDIGIAQTLARFAMDYHVKETTHTSNTKSVQKAMSASIILKVKVTAVANFPRLRFYNIVCT